MRKGSQLSLIKKEKSDYGGKNSTTRLGRSRPRPLAVKKTMHLVLRSTQATGQQSFKRYAKAIKEIVGKFGRKHHVHVISYVNVGNHLHLQIRLGHRGAFKPFIRAITSAIMMKVTGVSRWAKKKSAKKFWDQRPFTRICTSFAERLNLSHYVKVNFYQSMGYERRQARFLAEWERNASFQASG